MSEEPRGRSAYVLEKSYSGQTEWSLFFVYARREHIRALLQGMYVDHPDPEERQGWIDVHFDGESADLWLIENGRLTGHVDLRRFIRDADEEGGTRREVVLDRAGFEEAVPAVLAGAPLRHGQELHLVDAAGDFRDTYAQLPYLYPERPVRYGMQLAGDDGLSDEPYAYFTDPDPAP